MRNSNARTIIAVGVAILGFGFAVAAQAPSDKAPPEPRFEIVPAVVAGVPDRNGHAAEEHTVFLLERNSGRTWKFNQAAFAYRKDGSLTGPAMPAYFESVNADGFAGFDSKQAIKEWMQQQKP